MTPHRIGTSSRPFWPVLTKGEILIVNHEGKGWWDPQSDAKGDVFDLVQHFDLDLNFGQVRKALREFIGPNPSFTGANRRRESDLPDPTRPIWRIRSAKPETLRVDPSESGCRRDFLDLQTRRLDRRGACDWDLPDLSLARLLQSSLCAKPKASHHPQRGTHHSSGSILDETPGSVRCGNQQLVDN